MQTREFAMRARVDTQTLDHWLESGWLSPHENSEGRNFSQIDLARAQLIGDLHDFGINDEAIPVILDLIDQVNGLRNFLRATLTMIDIQRRE